MKQIAAIGRGFLNLCEQMGKSGIFIARSLIARPDFKVQFRLLKTQLFAVGVLSLVIILVASLFIGMVLGLQGYNILSRFGASQALGQLVALSLVRELAPVIGALLFVGRAGSALTAEIGLMKATEQLSSMEMMAVDPLRRIIAPRFWAGQISLPLLTIIFSAVAILGGYFVGVLLLGVDAGAYWGNMQTSVDFHEDIMNGLIKSVVFATATTWIAVFQGFSCKPTSEGVAQATTKTVVYGSLWVLGLDFFLTAVMFGGQ